MFMTKKDKAKLNKHLNEKFSVLEKRIADLEVQVQGQQKTYIQKVNVEDLANIISKTFAYSYEVKSTNDNNTDIKMQEAVDCIMQHFKTFYEQAINNEIASFAEPCKKCTKLGKCKCSWLTKLEPLFEKSNIKLNMAR